MNTYQDIKSKIAELQVEAEKLLKTERREAVAMVKAKISEFALTAQDLGLAAVAGSRKRGAKVASKKSGKTKRAGKIKVKAKYRNPDTGETWTGRGRPPRWLAALEAAGKSRDEFLIG